MPDLSTFQYLRWYRYPTGHQVLQGSEHEDGPWFRLTKREIHILNRTLANLPPDAVKELDTTP